MPVIKTMEKIEAGSLRGNLLLTLCRVAELSSSRGELSCTTGQLSAKLGQSQQTASRHLIELERLGLIRRVRITKRESIYVTSKGLDLLNEIYSTLKNVFELPVGEIYLEGKLFSGLGEGAYYINQEGYRKQFREKLGFDPYPGTLNIRLKAGYENKKSAIESLTLIPIEGFKTENRKFGPVKCAKVIINDGIEASVVLALRSHYGPDVIEIVSRENLRKKLKLKDGDTIEVRVSSPTGS